MFDVVTALPNVGSFHIWLSLDLPYDPRKNTERHESVYRCSHTQLPDNHSKNLKKKLSIKSKIKPTSYKC
jgi:hypothetical protein